MERKLQSKLSLKCQFKAFPELSYKGFFGVFLIDIAILYASDPNGIQNSSAASLVKGIRASIDALCPIIRRKTTFKFTASIPSNRPDLKILSIL